MINQNQMWSVLRMALSFGGGILVTFGYLTSQQLSTIIQSLSELLGPLAVIASTAWGLYTHTKAQTVAKAADIVPIDSHSQRSVGITEPQLVPTSPKVNP